MPNTKHGFGSAGVIVIILLALGVGAYFWNQKKVEVPAPTDVSTATTTPTTADTADWKTYKNDKYGFEVKYPSMYNPTELESGSFIVFVVRTPERGTIFSIRVSKYSLAQEEATIRAYPQISQFSKKDLIVDGNNFILLTYDFNSINGGITQPLGESLTEHNGLVYVIRHSSATLSKDIFDQILSTFRFVK